MTAFPRSGVYAITPSDLRAEDELLEQVRQVLAAGVAVLQYRDKQAPAARRQRLAGDLQTLCREYAVPLLINDDPQLALAVGADGAHLGQDDGEIATAARRWPQLLLGASCYASVRRAEAAAAGGASYVAFGRFFVSTTKPDASPAPLNLLQVWRRSALAADLPVVAIGGIDLGNGATLITAGADLLAVCAAIFDALEPAAAARALGALWSES